MPGTTHPIQLNVIINLMKRYQKNKLFDRLGCIHIQQQGELPPHYAEHFKDVTGIELVVIRIEEAMGKEKACLQDASNVLNMFSKTANSIDLVNIFRDRLILNYARSNNYNFILKGLNG